MARRLLFAFLIAMPLFCMTHFGISTLSAQESEVEYQEMSVEETDTLQGGGEAVEERTYVGRVYVYYGPGRHRPYQRGRRYFRQGYPYSPYSYRYYCYPYQRSLRYYKGGW